METRGYGGPFLFAESNSLLEFARWNFRNFDIKGWCLTFLFEGNQWYKNEKLQLVICIKSTILYYGLGARELLSTPTKPTHYERNRANFGESMK